MAREPGLDPELHDFAPKEMRERRFRQKFADACYDTLADERLVDFLAAVDGDTPEDIAVAGRRFFETLRFHTDEFVSHAAHCIETRPDRVFRCVTRMRSLVRRLMRPLSEAANSISSLGPGHTALDDN